MKNSVIIDRKSASKYLSPRFNRIKTLIFLISLSLLSSAISAQVNATDTAKTPDLYLVTKIDGTEYTGTIISDDGREVLIETTTLGKIYIPKADIKSMIKIEDTQSIINNEYQAAGPFTTRYTFTTNALPIEKGQNYALINLYGPEVHFALTNHFSLGVMTTWIGSPFVLAMKYSFKTSESNVNYSIGTLIGTSGYLNDFKGFGGLHFANVTLGDRKKNITFSAGYAYLKTGAIDNNPPEGVYQNYLPYNSDQLLPMTKGPICSVAGIFKVGTKASIIFDSMIGNFSKETSVTTAIETSPGGYDNFGNYIYPTYEYIVTREKTSQTALFLLPGMRFQKDDRRATQVSLGGLSLISDGVANSSPLPMVSWFYKF